MSKDIIVLTPNGRRQKVHCTPDTSVLQVLEDVCQKQGFQPSDYDLKHHSKILDLTSTIRFSNLPNKATLEMVEADKKREESNVVIGLLLEDGERRTAEFPSTMSLYNIITSLAPAELNSLQQPTILYMRQEVTGVIALQAKTLRQLGLIRGRAILRLLNKAEEARQANVSSVYRRPEKEKQVESKTEEEHLHQNLTDESKPGPSDINKHKTNVKFDPVQLLKEEKQAHEAKVSNSPKLLIPEHNEGHKKDIDMKQGASETKVEPMEIESNKENRPRDRTPGPSYTQETLERRLKIEDEVTFLGGQKAITFMQPDMVEDELEDLPDDFYELSVEEVRRLYNDLQRQRLSLENMPLLTSNKREELSSQSSLKLNTYKNVVVRIQFPDHIILQGIFVPSDKIEDVIRFIKEHLQHPSKPFHIFTTPFKQALDPKMTLAEAKFVPCVHMHFKWIDEDDKLPYLKEVDYLRKTSSDAAAILASKYRAPSRKTSDETSDSSQASQRSASTSKGSKVPKWFKN